MLAVLAVLAGASMTPGPDMRDVALRPPMGDGPPGILDSVSAPYTRTVGCGSVTITGTYINGSFPNATWSASPSGASGSCTNGGAGVFSCVVSVAPDAVGEGVETITVTDGDVANDQTVDLGFYVDGAHTCFLSQSVNGSYNVGLADLDAVATWENLGTSALDVTQGTGSLQPTFRTGIVGGQPVVRCDGGDRLQAATASPWIFMHNGTDSTISSVSQRTGTAAQQHIVTNKGASDIVIGARLMYLPTNVRSYFNLGGGATVWSIQSANNAAAINLFHGITGITDDDGGAGADGFLDTNGTVVSSTAASAYSAAASGNGLALCADGSALTQPLTGDIFRIIIYQSALTSTQRGINKAVDEWALGGTLPVTP